MTEITSEDVRKALLEDSEYMTTMPSFMRETLQPFAETLPLLLADKLEQSFTSRMRSETRLIFLKHLQENDFAGKAAEAASGDRRFANVYRELSAYLTQVIQGLTEMQGRAQYVSGDWTINFNEETLALSQKGELTVGQVLMLQPALIVGTG